MFTFSKRTDYALMALDHLAQGGQGKLVSAKEISEKYSIPGELLAKVLQTLSRNGFIDSQPGPSGGYRLARDSSEISLGSVVRAIEGEHGLCGCMKGEDPDCDQLECCSVREPLQLIHKELFGVLDKHKLSEFESIRRHNREPENSHIS